MKHTYNTNYWENYYENKNKMNESSFSKFSMTYIKPNESILDICSGDGRDSYFFKKNNLNVSSFDINKIETSMFNFINLDLNEKIPNFSFRSKFDNIYCRFVLHSVPEHIEDYILINCNNTLNKDGLVFIEVRSDKGEIINEIDNHYRRLINLDILKNKLINLNFEIIYEEEKNNLSIYKNDNPTLIRIVAKKKGNLNIHNKTDFHHFRQLRQPKNMDIDAAKYLLLTAKKILDDNNISFLILYGTLLGAYRDNNFIEYDSDVDIGVFDKDVKKVSEIIEQGYFNIYDIKILNIVNCVYCLSYKGEYMDVYLYRYDNNLKKYDCCHLNMEESQLTDGLSKINFLGVDFNSVNDIEKFLVQRYGNNWRTPIRDKGASF